jgi:hypothetical protein
MSTSCSGIKPSGERCKAAALKGESYCWFHSPNRGDARREASSRGGEVPASGSEGARAIRQRLRNLYQSVEAGETPAGKASSLVQIAHGELRCVTLETELQESGELLERLDAVEAALDSRENAEGSR